MNDPRKQRLVQSSVSISGDFVVLVYDIASSRIISEITDYSIELSNRQQLSAITVSKRIGQLVGFLAYLEKRRICYSDLSDSKLIDYRNAEVTCVLAQGASRANEQTAKRTVNDKLHTILAWLRWMQSSGRCCDLNVTLPIETGMRSIQDNGGRRTSAVKPSPVIFKQVGTGSKHKTSGIIDAAMFDSLQLELICRSTNPYIAQRDTLIVEIANTVGLRRASINSLQVDQFDRLHLESLVSDSVLIRPSKQKFGYQTEFPFPLWLALRICDFIDDFRTPLVLKKKITIGKNAGHVFLSVRDGSPMADRSITAIISHALRRVGAPKGLAIHGLRAKFANDQIRRELTIRRELGLDNSAGSVAAAVALRMGHQNMSSLYAYVATTQSLSAMGEAPEDKSMIHRLRVELLQAKAELHSLKKRKDRKALPKLIARL